MARLSRAERERRFARKDALAEFRTENTRRQSKLGPAQTHALPGICRADECFEIVPHGQTHCREHRPTQKRSPSSAEHIPDSLRRRILERAPYCLINVHGVCTGKSEVVDHVLALSQGGTTVESNLRGACRACNRYVAPRPARQVSDEKQYDLEHASEIDRRLTDW
jgi:5-methylcytosine-specific restriction endonuclease McrA